MNLNFGRINCFNFPEYERNSVTRIENWTDVHYAISHNQSAMGCWVFMEHPDFDLTICDNKGNKFSYVCSSKILHQKLLYNLFVKCLKLIELMKT
jgi:hypothetical protein